MSTEVRKQSEFDAPALEAAARALALQARVSEMEARGYNGNHASEYADEWWRSHLDRARHCLTAYLSALSEKGVRLMPREIDDKMWEAGRARYPTLDELEDGLEEQGEDVYFEVIPGPTDIWEAMFDAHSEPKS